MKNTHITLVYTLIFLLTFTGTLSLFTPAQAETWTNITLPYTITQGGNYRISGAFNGSGTALSINASNVVVDGQNNLLSLNQSEDNIAIAINPNSRNVLLENINETGADYGLYAEEGNFTLQDSLLTNNNSTAVFAFNVTAFIIQDSRTSNNTNGIVTIDCSNFTINDCHIKNNTYGVETVLSNNIVIQSSYFNNNTEAIVTQNCTNLQLTTSTFVENQEAIDANYTRLSANNISASDNHDYGIDLKYCNITAYNSQCLNNTVGLYAIYSNFTITNSSLSNNSAAGVLSGYCNGTLRDCALENNSIYGLLSLMSNSTVLDDCGIKNGEIGLYITSGQTFLLANSLIMNNSYCGLMEENCNPTSIISNNFTQNGLISDSLEFGGGAILQVDTNCTVTGNVFKNNYDSLLIGGFSEDIVSTQTYNYNTFNNDTYTFDLNYALPSNVTNHQFYFFNNYINDTNYINPISYSDSTYMPTPTVLHLNTTLQTGRRVIVDGGRMIGGNYWAHPNGTGPSQNATDINHDGFADTPFNPFGNLTVYDYLPYSSSFKETIVSLTISPSAASVKAGQSVNYTATATDQYGNSWNVTADCTINGNSFSGPLSITETGTYQIQASYGGQTIGTTLTVTPAQVDHYIVEAPSSVTAGSPFIVSVIAVDRYTNIVADYSGTVSFSTNGSSVSPSTSGAFAYGIWMGNLTVVDTGAFTVNVADSSGNSGKSIAVSVNAETEPTVTPTPTPTPTSTEPTGYPTNPTGVSDPYWWVWIVALGLVIVVLAAAAVYFVKHGSRKPKPQ